MRMTGGVVGLAVVAVMLGASGGAAQPRLVGPFPKDEYPQAVIDRPLTLPAGMVEGELGATYSSIRFDRTLTSPLTGINQWTTDVTLRYGITDRIQVETGTSFSLDYEQVGDHGFQGVTSDRLRPSFTSWQHVVPVRLSLLALDTETLDTAVALTVPFVAHVSRRLDLGRGGEFDLENTPGHVIPAVGLEAPTRWRLTDWLWFRAGERLFSVTTDDVFASFAFDFGVGVQPHPMFAMTLDTLIAAVAFNGSGDSFSQTLADRGTIDLEGTFAPCRWFDLVGQLALPNVGAGFDDWATRMAVRLRF